MKRVLPILIITLFLAGLFVTPSVGITLARLQENSVNDMLISELPNDPVFRVALYNETNSTLPSYGHGGMNTNYSAVTTFLNSAGFDVDILTFQNIQDYELTTVNYDVVVLADNLPRENITNHVKDFWLAGGGVMSFDSAISYLGYAGILFRENESVYDGYSTFWAYYVEQNNTVVESHPVSQSYSIGDTIETLAGSTFGTVKRETFNTTTVWGQTTVLTVDDDDPDLIRALAVDAYDRGGRVVHFASGGGGQWWSTDYEDMVADAIDWLAPKPKAKIAYDMTHQPRLSVDGWDVFSTLASPTENFEDLRDLYVANRYTFDKFMPSASGNFTAARLNEYDIMVIDWPDLNYTAADRTALMAWLDDGGGLIVLGDRNQMIPMGGHENLNFLLDDLDMYLAENNTLDNVNAVPAYPYHPTIGSASSLAISYRNYINISGPGAQAVWEFEDNIIVAAQQYGSGRVVMFGDMNILSSSTLGEQHNRGYATNIANWLSSDNATILVYSDDPYDGGAYRSSVAQVLNQKQLKFHMTVSDVGFNASVNGTWFAQETWDLVIVDHCNFFYDSIYDGLYDYLQNGGRAIVNTFVAHMYVDNPIWNYIGVNSTGSWPSDASAHIWDTGHDIFNTPFNMSQTTMTVSGAYFGSDGCTVEVYDNATALAGFSSTENDGNASIVLNNANSVLLNTFLLNNMRGDEDNSGYLDTFELWYDQITYMLETESIPTGGGIFDLDLTTLLLIGAGVIVVIIIIAVVVRKRGSTGGAKPKAKKKSKKKK